MKRLLLTLLLVIGLCSPALGQAQATLDCHGTESGGNGLVDCDTNPRRYAYRVITGDNPITEVFIGTEDGNVANYRNICMPSGWTFEIVDGGYSYFTDKTPHGQISPGGQSPGGPYRIMFDEGVGDPIPAGGATFSFGFDHRFQSHDVGWRAQYSPVDWTEPVGLGQGPVHSPGKVDIPTLSPWGLIILLAILVAIATWVVLKRRRVVTA